MIDDCLSGLGAVATRTRKRVNQDACAAVRFGSGQAVLVADGLGSHFGAEVASAVAVESIRHTLQTPGAPAEPDLRGAFADAQRALVGHVAAISPTLPADLDRSQAFGTTLVCAADTPARLILAYVGNGGLIHLRGNFNDFPPAQVLPWNALNYLNPHSISTGGHNVLYKLLSPWTAEAHSTPTVLSIAKENDLYGDIIMACSDGVHSYDQTPIGRDDERRIWISGERALSLFYEALDAFFAESVQDDASLQACLETYLSCLDAEHPLSDDATLGVVISAQALRHQEARRQRNRASREPEVVPV